jgi:acyl-CoA reductase-like NAD-dependent aldehyde dehydrogenase
MGPTVIENVDKSMHVYYEESFGPTVSLYSIDSDEEAIHLANDTEYGLSCSVFTTNLSRGLNIAGQVETGYALLFVSRLISSDSNPDTVRCI